MQISTANLLAATSANASPLEKGEKLAKGKSAANLPLNLEKDLALTGANQQTLKSVITNLLMNLSQEVKSKSAIFEMIQNTPMFKNMGSFSADLKALIMLLKNEPTMSKTVLLLENFQKGMTGLDGKLLKEQVQNSGIFFESKLAQKISAQTQLNTIKNLIPELQEHLTQTNKSSVIGKALENTLLLLSQKVQSTPQELHTQLKSVLDLFRQSVKQHLSFESTPILKESYAAVLTLEQVLQNTPLIASKVQNSVHPAMIEQTFTQQVKTLLTALKEALPQISTLNTADTLEQLPFSFEEVATQLGVLLETKSFAPQILTEIGMNTQEQLTMVANRLKQVIELVDPQSFKQVKYIDNALSLEQKIQSLLKPETFNNTALMQKLSLTPSDMEILGDMKGVLTKLGDQLSTMSLKSNESIDLVQKLTTQIEYHQLLSYVSASNHLYIPLSWNGLKEGSMQMKQANEESFYCQIDLDLEQYGKLNMMLFLSQNNSIDITIATQKSELQKKVMENLQELKMALNEVGLITGNVKLIDYKENNFAKHQYGDETLSNFGINIKI
ncbi:MAG: flagellar hook-length control protein FliK [Sulfurospirillaceae bacterium]|nr:flagellar hook-length control protein FliK [Sulfurospirillaceae bacterium]